MYICVYICIHKDINIWNFGSLTDCGRMGLRLGAFMLHCSHSIDLHIIYNYIVDIYIYI